MKKYHYFYFFMKNMLHFQQYTPIYFCCQVPIVTKKSVNKIIKYPCFAGKFVHNSTTLMVSPTFRCFSNLLIHKWLFV